MKRMPGRLPAPRPGWRRDALQGLLYALCLFLVLLLSGADGGPFRYLAL